MSMYNASGWVVAGFIISMVVKLTNNLVMARLVAPDAFGLVAVATVSLLGLQMLADVGLRQSIIRKESNVDDLYQDTVWVTQLLKGGVVSLFLLIIALALYFWGDYIGGVYSSELLPFIMLLISLSPIISGFEQTKVALQNRNLVLGRLTIIDIISQVMGLAVGVLIAIFGYGIWGLVVGPLIYNLLRVFLTAIFLQGRLNRIRFEKGIFTELLSFGKWVVLSSVVSFLAYYGDQLILARFLSAEKLGFVAIAVFFVGVARSLITKLSNDVFFAKLSAIYRNSPHLLKDYYYRCRRWTDAYLLVVAGGLFMTSETIVSLLYDDRYQSVAEILRILSLSLIFERYMLFSPLCWVMNRPRTPALIQTLKVSLLFIGLPFTIINFELVSALYFIAFYKIIELPIVLYLKFKADLLSLSHECLNLFFFPIGLFAGYAFVYVVGFFL